MFIISVEGNIGSGKSTFLDMLKMKYASNQDIVFIDEPLDSWNKITDMEGKTMLEKFYSDKEKHGFAFQMMAYISRLAQLKKTIDTFPNAIIVTERSLLTDRHVFAKMLYDEGYIEHAHYKIYLEWFNTFIKDMAIEKIIYLKTSPEKSYERIQRRNRKGETIPISYIEQCHEYHEMWLNTFKRNQLLIIDANQDMMQNPNDYLSWLQMFDGFVLNSKGGDIGRCHSDHDLLNRHGYK